MADDQSTTVISTVALVILPYFSEIQSDFDEIFIHRVSEKTSKTIFVI